MSQIHLELTFTAFSISFDDNLSWSKTALACFISIAKTIKLQQKLLAPYEIAVIKPDLSLPPLH